MVEFTILDPYSEDLESLIPDQRLKVYKLFKDGLLHSYTLASDRSKLWAVFAVDSESELVKILHELPMHNYMDYDYSELMFHNSSNFIPSLSLN
jgi:muconolactone delta-isomerase